MTSDTVAYLAEAHGIVKGIIPFLKNTEDNDVADLLETVNMLLEEARKEVEAVL